MSNALAIAAVTATLSSLLHNVNQGTGLSGVSITTKPPDKARDSNNGNQINLFLYQILPNGAWRNMDIPQRVRSGETAIPPLALNLYYMLTSYGEGNDDVLGHRLLGHAMSILYDHPLLGAPEIATALGSLNSELQNQVERVRITLQPLSVEEIFRLWSGFQTQYRISVAYEVAVVLIESTQQTRTPLPVLTRGPADSGVTVQGSLIPPFPTIEEIVLPHPPSTLMRNDPGDPTSNDLTLKGHDLLPGPDPTRPADQQIDNSKTLVRFINPRWLTAVDLEPKPGATQTAEEITVALPDDTTNWPAGFYSVALVFRNASGDVVRTSNEKSFSLAPSITIDAPSVTKDAHGTITDVTITVHARPAVQQTVQRVEQGMEQTMLQEQRVSLLVGDRETPFAFPAPPDPLTAPVSFQDLTFDIGSLPAGPYFVRLRVDGVDSLLINRNVVPPQFDTSQMVVIA